MANPPPPKVNYRALYPWALDGLLDEYSSLVSTKAWRDHVGESSAYDHRAFAKKHDDDIAVLPCTLGEHVCGGTSGPIMVSPSSTFTRWFSSA